MNNACFLTVTAVLLWNLIMSQVSILCMIELLRNLPVFSVFPAEERTSASKYNCSPSQKAGKVPYHWTAFRQLKLRDTFRITFHSKWRHRPATCMVNQRWRPPALIWKMKWKCSVRWNQVAYPLPMLAWSLIFNGDITDSYARERQSSKAWKSWSIRTVYVSEKVFFICGPILPKFGEIE